MITAADPTFLDGLRHAAEEDAAAGHSLQAAYIRAAVAEIERLRAALAEFHWMARRYCDGRMSTAPHSFNTIVRDLLASGTTLREPHFARDGMGRSYDGLTYAEAEACEADALEAGECAAAIRGGG